MISKTALIAWVRKRIEDKETPASDLVDYQLFVNLTNKGRDISTSENRQFKRLLVELEQRYEDDSDDVEEGKPGKKLIGTSSEMTYLFSVSRERLSVYCKKGMPKLSRGKYDVRACLRWWLDNIYINKGDDRDVMIRDDKRRFSRFRADEQELKVAKIKEILVSRKSLDELLNKLFSDIRGTMLSWPNRVFPNDPDNRIKLKEETHRLLEQFKKAKSFSVFGRKIK